MVLFCCWPKKCKPIQALGIYQVTREEVVAGALPVDDEGDVVVVDRARRFLEHEIVDFAVAVNQDFQVVQFLKFHKIDDAMLTV